METDNQLLAEYAHRGSERAFRELVQRHINMVHSAAVREARGSIPVAEDITQQVFTELARRAAKLLSHPAIAGWLYTCVRQMAANIRRAEDRRQRREQETVTMNELLGSNPTDQLWQQVRPVLDDVMHELDQEDRTAVVLRFFEGQSLKEVGTALGLTENAARMRVERSLEKLHGLLSRRGINSTASTLAVVLVAGTVMSASSTFASTVATGAMTTAAAGSFATGTSAKLLAIVKSKTVVFGALALAAAAIILWRHFDSNSAKTTMATQPPVPAPVASVANGAVQNDSVIPPTAVTNIVASSQMALQLVDAETGEVLPGAKLHLFYLFEDGRGKVVKAVTDAAGRLKVDLAQTPYRALNMFVTADGHVPKVTTWGFRRQMPSEYTMKLERGVSISGVVVDEAGQPIAGAKIEVDNPGNDMSLAENIQFGPDATVITDVNGQWSCNMIPREFEQISLSVKDKEHAETNVTVQPAAPDANKLVIMLPDGFSIAGVVQDSKGNPIEGAKIRQVRPDEENEHSATTDGKGAFEFKGMGAGELTLAVQVNGFAPMVQTLQVAGNMAALKFQLGPGELLRGRVVDEEGNPVAKAFVETTRRSLDKIQWSTNTDADGRFEWNSAPEEPLLYSVLAEGFNRAYAQTLQADGSEHEIKLARKQPDKDMIQITGTAVDADTGQPLDTFKIFVSDLEADWAFPLEFYTTGKDGQFTLSLPAKSDHPGYAVQIEQEGYLPAVSANYLRTNGNQKLDFKLQKGAGPTGVVLLPNGEPAVNAAVLLCTPLAGVTMDRPAHVQKGLNTTTYRTQTDAAGKFLLTPAIDPQGLIIIHDQGYAEVSLTDLAAASNVTLQAWGSVKGKLILDSRPVANEHVVAANQVLRYSAAGRSFGFVTFRLETTTDADGNFSFDKVPPGPCQVFREQEASRSRFSSHDTSVTVKAGAVTEVVLGGTGRPIIGKAILPGTAGSIDWQKVPVRLESKTGKEPGSRPKREEFPTIEAFVAASENYFQSFKNEQHFGAFCDSDGSFRVSDVPAGTYELKIDVRDFKLNSAAPHDISDPSPILDSVVREVIVPEDKNTEPLDLGTLELAPPQNSASVR